MSMFRKVFGLGLPLAATLAAASYAAADDVVAYFDGIGGGQSAGDCDNTSGGFRGIIAGEAVGESVDARRFQFRTVTYASGTSASTSAKVGSTGIRHKARLISELTDLANGVFATKELCAAGWSSGFVSDASTGTNITTCSASVRSSVNNGTCRSRTFNAYSLGMDN